MVSEYYFLILLYPLSYILYSLAMKLKINEKHILKVIFTLFFFVFYFLFSSYIVSRAENSYLIIATLIYCLAIYSEELKLFTIYKYFTYFWFALMLIWGFFDFRDSALLLGVIPLLVPSRNLSKNLSKAFLWISIVFMSFLIPKIGVKESLIIKNWLMELLFVLIFAFTIPSKKSKHFSVLLESLLCLGVFHVSMQSFGLMPSVFVKCLLFAQLVAFFLFIQSESLYYMVVSLLFGSIVLIPYEGVSTILQISLIVYSSVFIFDKYKLSKFRSIYSVIHLLSILFIFNIFYSVDLASSWIKMTSILLIMLTTLINFMFRERLFLSRKLIKIGHG